MKYINLLFLFVFATFLNSCEDVVPVNLNAAPPKLVIDAAINWQKGTSGNEQKIILTTTTDFYSNTIPTVSGALVQVKNSNNIVYNFIEKPNSGEYLCTNFLPQINETYTLTVSYNGQTYTAEETLKSVAPIEKIVQNNEGGFTGTDIEIKTFYTDPADVENYYLYKYKYNDQAKSDFFVDLDLFFQGNTFFSISQKNDLEIGDKIEIFHYGISKGYYNYLKVLLSLGNSGGGPFQSPPATVRGNIINTTDTGNYALGYFRLSEVATANYTVQ